MYFNYIFLYTHCDSNFNGGVMNVGHVLDRATTKLKHQQLA